MKTNIGLALRNPQAKAWLESLRQCPGTIRGHERNLDHLFQYIHKRGGPEPENVKMQGVIPVRHDGILLGHGPISGPFLEEFLQSYAGEVEDLNRRACRRNRMISTLRLFLRSPVMEEVLVNDPMYHIRTARERERLDPRKYLTPEETARLYEVARNSGEHRLRNTVILMTLLQSGLRPGELCGLRLRDINFDTGWTYASGKEGLRGAPIPPVLLELLRRYVASNYFAQRSGGGQYLFPNDAATASLTPIQLNKLVQQLCRDAGIDRGVTTYWTRHTFATDFYRAGGSFVLVAQALGHKKLKNTAIYVHGRDERMRLLVESGGAAVPLLNVHRKMFSTIEPKRGR